MTDTATHKQILDLFGKLIDQLPEKARAKVDHLRLTHVSFIKNMKGAAGYAFTDEFRIELNEQLFLANREAFFKQTIPHELAHLVVEILYPDAKQAHGPEFRRLMAFWGFDSSTRIKYDREAAGIEIRKQPLYVYECACETQTNIFKFSSTIHKRIEQGDHRRCRSCHERVVYTGITLNV